MQDNIERSNNMHTDIDEFLAFNVLDIAIEELKYQIRHYEDSIREIPNILKGVTDSHRLKNIGRDINLQVKADSQQSLLTAQGKLLELYRYKLDA